MPSAVDRLELALNGTYESTGVHGLRSRLAEAHQQYERYTEIAANEKEKIKNIEEEINEVEQAIIYLLDRDRPAPRS